MTVTPSGAGCRMRRARSLSRFATLLLGATLALPGTSQAQDASLVAGDGAVTQFGGFLERERRNLDPDGVVARVMQIETGGAAPAEPDELTSLTAEEVGQVFAVEIAGADRPAIYLGASSAFGLYRNEDGSDWATGMWGEGGGPGTIWKLEPGGDPQPFVTLGTEDRPNQGAGIGDLAHDEAHNRLIASDLSSGMIHTIDLETGEIRQTFDHGVDGRSYFLDAQSGEYLVLDVVPEDTRRRPRFEDCRDAGGQTVAFASEPSCWAIADYRRRVWGVGVAENPSGEGSRLYYAVWGGAALGSDAWRGGTDDARTSIWSVRLDRNGNFDLTDVRREVVLPPLDEAGEETAPVVDMVIPDAETMIVAERGKPAPDLQGDPATLVEPQKARVLVLRRSDDTWRVDGRFDAGAAAGDAGLRVSAAGGVALGARGGPTGDGAAIAPGGRLWMTVDPLCIPEAPCEGIQAEERVAGLQATRLSAASVPTGEGDGSFVVPRAADAIVLARGLPIGSIGQVTIHRGYEVELNLAEGPRVIPTTREPEPDQAEASAEPQPIPDQQAEAEPEPRPRPEPQAETEPELEMRADVVLGRSEADLAVTGRAVEGCEPGSECVVEFTVSNAGPSAFEAPLVLTGTPGSSGVSVAGTSGDGWSCTPSGGVVTCVNASLDLAPQAETDLQVRLTPGRGYGSSRLEYCMAVTWLGRESRDRTRAVQAALREEGFDPGSVDGAMGPNTRSAISDAQRAADLPVDGTVSGPLVVELFGPGAFLEGDAGDGNDRACATAEVDLPPRPAAAPQRTEPAAPRRTEPRVDRGPAHRQSVSAFHQRHQSRFHDPATSTPVEAPQPSRPQVRDRDGFHDSSSSRFAAPRSGGGNLRVHEIATSQTRTLHEVRMSRFHDQAPSAVHDPRTSRGRIIDRDGPANSPLQHDRPTSRVRPAY